MSRGSLLAEFERTEARTGRVFHLHAQFLDARGVPAETAMQALEVWSFDEALDRDACSLRRRPAPSSSAGPGRSRSGRVDLELLDVGPITVRGPRRTIRLDGRRLPDLSSTFSGVVYGLDKSEGTTSPRPTYRPGRLYTFEAPGERETGSFRVALRAPPPIELQLPGTSRRSDGTVVLRRGRALELRWTPARRSNETVFFDVSTGFGPDDLHLKCRLEDDGAFRLPTDVLDQLSSETSSLRIALRRVRTKPASIEGLDVSRFTLATVDRRRFLLRP
jgi:hypothetical protein